VHLEEQQSVPFCRLISLKRRVRAAPGRVARPKLLVCIYLGLWVLFKHVVLGGGAKGRGAKRRGEGEGGRGGVKAKGRGMMFVCCPSQLGINAQQTGE
jgi:hypothetical protein